MIQTTSMTADIIPPGAQDTLRSEYLAYAAQAQNCAAKAKSDKVKAIYLSIADDWLRRIERLEQTVNRVSHSQAEIAYSANTG
jgi:hypothetical protein